MDEEMIKIVAVLSKDFTFVGEAVFDSLKRVVSLTKCVQIFHIQAMTPNGPLLVTVAMKLGELEKLPDNHVISYLDTDSPHYKEWSARWYDIKITNDMPRLVPINAKKVN